ncbi:unnamed protein product [Ilex paraguariensis]|uniref:RING-type domain-containing protein n=1 Tax=Ilex paraguariensis TaxID=185542 RepID=A0ABC8UJ53_9AQUA
MPRFYAPPPVLTIEGGATTTTTTNSVVTEPQLYNNGGYARESSSSSSSSSTSIMIVVIVIASAIIVSASIYLLLRFFSRRFHRSFRTFSTADDVVSNMHHCVNDQHVSSNELLDALPLFTFGSVTGNLTGVDCAVCLSKFEPQDQLRLLPLCCHAFHAHCIDTWISSNQTCPLCRSTVHPTESDVLNKVLVQSEAENRGSGNSSSFRIEIGSVSRRRGTPESVDGRRSYSIGSFEYIVEDGHEVAVGSTRHHRGLSDCTSVDKESIGAPVPEPPGEGVAGEVSGGRSWLRDYVDRLPFVSLSSRTMSFGSSGRFFTGSSRRSDTVVPVEDLEANRIGEEISELFRWLSGKKADEALKVSFDPIA